MYLAHLAQPTIALEVDGSQNCTLAHLSKSKETDVSESSHSLCFYLASKHKIAVSTFNTHFLERPSIVRSKIQCTDF